MDIALKKLKDILKREIGLDASTLGDATIDKILHQRMHYCQTDTLNDYYHYVIQHNDELTALLETAVIPETWFFRDTRPFKLVAEQIKKNLKKNDAYHCNILCIPCSTGEEPYSIAMYLLHSGIKPSCFSINAIDISSQAISLAKQAVYGKNSFRNETSKEYQAFYFDQKDGKDILKDNIRSLVLFSQMSILNNMELSSLQKKFDFVFCRNLLIYFDLKTKELAFKNLHQIMKSNAMLFIGHSEFGSVPKKIFTLLGSEQAFGLIKTSSRKQPETPQKKNTGYNDKIYKKPLQKPSKPASLSFQSLIKPEKKQTQRTLANNKNNDLLTLAQQLADQNRLSEAESACFEFIDKYGDKAESFFILGLINEASQHNDRAEDFFKKAIYLDPKHYKSLIHLAQLVKKSGDIKASELLMKRARRIETT